MEPVGSGGVPAGMNPSSPPPPPPPQAPGRNTLVRILEPLAWLGLALFVIARFGPQIEAWTGLGPPPERTLPAALAVTTLDGEQLGPDELAGKVRVFTFWATWCRVCGFELPGVDRLHREWGEDVAVVTLSIDRMGAGGVREHVRGQGYSFPVALAGAELRRALGATRAVPTTVIADREGRIHHVLVGVSGPGTLERAVRRLVES